MCKLPSDPRPTFALPLHLQLQKLNNAALPDSIDTNGGPILATPTQLTTAAPMVASHQHACGCRAAAPMLNHLPNGRPLSLQICRVDQPSANVNPVAPRFHSTALYSFQFNASHTVPLVPAVMSSTPIAFTSSAPKRALPL